MDIKRKQPDLSKVFNQTWNANNYKTNGVVNQMNQSKERFNKINGIKSKEQEHKEILRANSVEGQIERLNQQMNTLKNNNKLR